MAEGDGRIEGGTVEVTGFVTYAGKGFGAVRTAPSTGERPTPETVSARAYLRDGLPGIYRDDDLAMRFLEALERVLDPIVAVLDSLPAYVDPKLAPVDLLDLVTRWLGLEYDEHQPVEQLRALVRDAPELGRLRGTRAGLAMALERNFPGLPLRIEDHGGVTWSVAGEPPPQTGPPSFVVYCDEPVPEERQAAIARVIEAVKPVHVAYRLRVKAPRAPAAPQA